MSELNYPHRVSRSRMAKRSVELEISILFAQWLQGINQEQPRRVDVTDLLAGTFLCNPTRIERLAVEASRFLTYLEAECHVFSPPWVYQYHFSRRSENTEENRLMLFSDQAAGVLGRSEAIALGEQGSQASSLVTVGHLLEAIIVEKGPVGQKLLELGFSVPGIRQAYAFYSY